MVITSLHIFDFGCWKNEAVSCIPEEFGDDRGFKVMGYRNGRAENLESLFIYLENPAFVTLVIPNINCTEECPKTQFKTLGKVNNLPYPGLLRCGTVSSIHVLKSSSIGR